MFDFQVRPLGPISHAFSFASIILLAVCLFSGSMVLPPVEALAAEGRVIHEGAFNPAEMRWDADSQGVAFPVLDGTRPLGEPGLPQLPVRDLILLVPLEAEVGNLWIEPLETHREQANQDLALAPSPIQAR